MKAFVVLAALDVLIRGAQVHTQTAQGQLDNADVLVRGGKIAAVGKGLSAPAGVETIEAGGRPLTPGLFGGLTQIGLVEVGQEAQTADGHVSIATLSLRERWRPDFDVVLAYNPRSTIVPVTRMEGITWAVLTPGSDGLIAGQGAAIVLDGRYDAEIAGSRSLFVAWGGGGKGIAGGSRAAQYMLFDQVIREARDPTPNEETALLYPAGREALVRYLAGGRMVFYIDRAADIHQFLVYARRQGLKPIIAGAAEGWVVADELARAAVPVILNPLENLPGHFDSLEARLDNAALLHAAGVRIAFSEEKASHNARKNRQLAGNAVAHGLPWDVALAALTSAPAEIFGMGATRGHIAAGQVADLVLWSADPLEVSTLADAVWIGGQRVPMSSRQTLLRDRYLERLKTGRAR